MSGKRWHLWQVAPLENSLVMPVIALLSVARRNIWVAIREYISTLIVCIPVAVKQSNNLPLAENGTVPSMDADLFYVDTVYF